MKAVTTYPIARDHPETALICELRRTHGLMPHQEIRAVATGEFHQPRAGEWFLSGAAAEAYYAPDDLASGPPYPIARLVRATKRTEYDVEELG